MYKMLRCLELRTKPAQIVNSGVGLKIYLLQVALDALRAHVRLTGDSDRLPDPLLGQLNSEQLFFLTLSQEFCADRPPAYSPGDEPVDYTLPLRRVLGNDERFRKSFQCKDGDVYAPLRRVLVSRCEFQ